MKASKWVQRLKKTIKNLAEPFEGSEFYPRGKKRYFQYSKKKTEYRWITMGVSLKYHGSIDGVSLEYWSIWSIVEVPWKYRWSIVGVSLEWEYRWSVIGVGVSLECHWSGSIVGVSLEWEYRFFPLPLPLTLCHRVKFRSLKGSAKFFIVFFSLWTHLEAFTFLQNLF